jgi:integrase
MGELLALRWRNVDFLDARLVVHASWSAGVLTSPKSRKTRSVPLADQPAAVLAQLAARECFAGRDDLVFCSAVGVADLAPRLLGGRGSQMRARGVSSPASSGRDGL